MRVKICGITRAEDAQLCERLGVNALGFIFYPGSPRYIDPDRAKSIISKIGPFTQTVGVFVDESAEHVNSLVAHCGLNMVQLHGAETPEYVSEMIVPVIKAFRVKDDFEYALLDRFREHFLLLDAYAAGGYGGTGKTFDWSRIPKEIRSKLILAGGVSLENIEYIYQHIRPAAVDLSSSLESAPGIKDHEKVRAFMEKVRELNKNDNK